jgi:hypothetical protein
VRILCRSAGDERLEDDDSSGLVELCSVAKVLCLS